MWFQVHVSQSLLGTNTKRSECFQLCSTFPTQMLNQFHWILSRKSVGLRKVTPKTKVSSAVLIKVWGLVAVPALNCIETSRSFCTGCIEYWNYQQEGRTGNGSQWVLSRSGQSNSKKWSHFVRPQILMMTKILMTQKSYCYLSSLLNLWYPCMHFFYGTLNKNIQRETQIAKLKNVRYSHKKLEQLNPEQFQKMAV